MTVTNSAAVRPSAASTACSILSVSLSVRKRMSPASGGAAAAEAAAAATESSASTRSDAVESVAAEAPAVADPRAPPAPWRGVVAGSLAAINEPHEQDEAAEDEDRRQQTDARPVGADAAPMRQRTSFTRDHLENGADTRDDAGAELSGAE